jgi:hypothetical protein
MQHILIILLQLVSTLASLLRPGGTKALVAENLLLKHQLLILRRSRQRAPNLRSSDRLLFGLGSLCLSPRRLVHTAILIKPSTLLRCHQALTKLKFKRLYSSGRQHQPGPNCNFSQTGDRFPEVTDLGRRSSAQGAHFSKLR